MGVEYGGEACNDVIEAARWARHAGVDPSGWEGKANGYACPTGTEPGEGNILLRRSQLRKLAKGRQDLSIRDPYDLVIEYNGDKVTLKNLYVVAAVSCHPSPDDDDNALYHVRLADVRYVLKQFVLSKGYNLRTTPTGNYQPGTTADGAGTAWTWAQIKSDIWGYLPTKLAGPIPALPSGTRDESSTPEELNFYGKYALDAFGLVADRLGQAPCYDPFAGTFSLVVPGAKDAAADAAERKYRDPPYRLDDAGPVEPVPGRIPASVRVLFRKEPERAYGNNPWHEVSVPGGFSGSGALSGSEEILLDDLIAQFQGGELTNSGDLESRASGRASEFWTARAQGASRLQRTYRGPIGDFKPGSRYKVVAWRDAGRGQGPLAGVTTDTLRFPPDAMSRWPSTPAMPWRLVEEVEVLGSGSASGTTGSGAAIQGYCAAKVSAVRDNGDGTSTWTFVDGRCCEDGSLDSSTGDCTRCGSFDDACADTFTVTATTGLYPGVGNWVQTPQSCAQGGNATTPPTGYTAAVARRWNADRDEHEYLFDCWLRNPDGSALPTGVYPVSLFVGFKSGRPAYMTDGQAAVEDSFLATLTAKDFSGPFISYSWTRVIDSEILSDPADPSSPKTIIYTLADQSGGPGNFPAYHEQNIDLAICDSHSGSGASGTGSGNPIVGGPACYCAGRILSSVNNGDGTLTWTFDNLQCCEDGSLQQTTGACAPCVASMPCPSGQITVTAPVGTYITTPGYWAQLGTVCLPSGDETPETCVVRLRKGKGDWYFIDHEPRWEVVEITAGSGGSYTGFVLGYDQIAGSLFRFQAAYIIDANSLP